MRVFYRVLCSTALVAISAAASAEDLSYSNADKSFTVNGGIGLMNIDAGEFVYEGDYKVSQLDWESRGIVLFTLGANLELPHEMNLKATLSTGLNGDGHMVDYDWLYPGHAGPNGMDDWTHRSVHPATNLDHYWAGSLELDKQIFANDDTTFSLGGGFKYTDVKWTSTGGSAIYSQVTFRDTQITFPDGEKGISYRQQIPVTYAVLNMTHEMGDLTLGAGVKGGLSFGIQDTDDHWMRDLRFKDDISIAPVLGVDLSASYAVAENTALYISGSYEKIFHARGDTTMTDTITGAAQDFKDGSGADFQSMSVSFGVKMKF